MPLPTINGEGSLTALSESRNLSLATGVSGSVNGSVRKIVINSGNVTAIGGSKGAG